MSTAFRRSLRTLETDGFRPALVGIPVVGALVGLWIAWFFFAQITLYEASDTARLVDTSTVVAEFPPAALGRVQPGQRAVLRLDGFPWTQFGALSATVTSVTREGPDEQVRVELTIQPDPTSVIPLQAGLPGTVEIIVDRTSPAALVLRSAGLRPGMPAALNALRMDA